jgi:hypothetical protein
MEVGEHEFKVLFHPNLVGYERAELGGKFQVVQLDCGIEIKKETELFYSYSNIFTSPSSSVSINGEE